MIYPKYFRTVLSTEDFDIEVDEANKIVKIQGVQYSFEIFDHIAKPDPTKLYQISRDGDQVIFTLHQGR
jgi:hypothetical protein